MILSLLLFLLSPPFYWFAVPFIASNLNKAKKPSRCYYAIAILMP